MACLKDHTMKLLDHKFEIQELLGVLKRCPLLIIKHRNVLLEQELILKKEM